jgi:hypothetical protein
MYRTVEAIYKEGHVIPLEDIEAEEESKLLIIVMDAKEDLQTGVPSWKKLKGKYKNSLSTVDQFIARKEAEKAFPLFAEGV